LFSANSSGGRREIGALAAILLAAEDGIQESVGDGGPEALKKTITK
jgi:hypothetical protein